MKTKIVATQFQQAKAEGISEGSKVSIINEPENRYDDKALAIYFGEEKLGYIGKGTDAYDIPRNMFPMEATVIDFYFRQEGDNFTKHELGTLVSANIEIEDVVELDPTNDIPSFNEEGVIINFNEETHTYTYNGRILGGATKKLKDYVEEFQSDMIADRCATSWGLSSKFIKSVWRKSGDLSREFGSGIHKALEFEDLYRHYHKKNGARCFTIKQPAIKKIVEDFFALYEKLGFEGEVIPEALVSDVENDQAGLIDRLLIIDREKKICRIQDYKSTHSVEKKGEIKLKNLPEPYINMPTTKLTKMSLQLKVYAEQLEKSGWTVLGFDIFVYDGEWSYYEIDPLAGLKLLD